MLEMIKKLFIVKNEINARDVKKAFHSKKNEINTRDVNAASVVYNYNR